MRLLRSTRVAGLALVLAAAALGGCERPGGTASNGDRPGAANDEAPAAPSNRVDIPAPVRRSLGITFARVEYRNVAQTLRVPGRFELHPTARREYRTPLRGRVDLVVTQYQRVPAGAPLYRMDSAAWRDLHEQIAAARARAESMAPLREAHRVHERSLADKVQLWQERLKQLDDLRAAGGGSAAQFTEARATLSETQAELADVMEKDAELHAQQKQVEAELRSLESRRGVTVRAGACGDGGDASPDGAGYVVCAVAPGVVESVGVTPGGLTEENDLVLTLVQPERIRFRARGLQSDLGLLRDGLATLIAPPQGGSIALQDAMSGKLMVGLAADADERTVDLITEPERLASWARAGVSAYLEIVLAGGQEELAVPLSAVVRDGATPIIFRRDPADPDRVIRLEADVGVSDGRWVVVSSGVKEGDEVVLGGSYQLMLATSGTAAAGGHFHPDGTFHEGEH